ncbi:MAG: protein kinase domain-containing protein [Hyalangium sp.]|uniref:serine/threonine-protein kinase n=1 Tax=Hyalangium sp. TaxID=2028555 RepID=UPI00389AC855
MRSLLKCSQCGAMLPPGSTVCPRDGARAVADNPFVDEATVRSPSAGARANGKTPPSGVMPQPAPAQAEPDEDVDEKSWEATVSRDVLVGKKLGDFVVKRRIGAGGMGIVYEGEHPIIGRKVAIKILRPEFSEGARDLIAEARAASAIRHRGIIDVFGFGTIPHIGQYLVMEYLEGTPLDEIISQRAPMLEVEVIALLDELLAALGAAHAMGVIHRDLKPGNIFVVRDSGGGESVKVLDFGLAKRTEMPHGTTPQTRGSMIVGTPEYMAPEQATGQSVGPHTDLYAVGVIAFEMLTRRLPFEGTSAMAIAIQHVQAKPPAPSTYVDLHPDLDELVLRLLAKTTDKRPTSAEAVRRELKQISRLLADGATRLEPSPRGEKPSDELPNVRPERFAAPAPERPAPRNPRPAAESITVTRKTPGTGETPVSQPRLAPLTREPASARPARVGSGTFQASADPEPRASPLSTERVPVIRPNRLPQLAVAGVIVAVLAGLGIWALRRGDTPTPVPPTVVEAPANPDKPIKPTPPVVDSHPANPPVTNPQVTVTPPGQTVKPPQTPETTQPQKRPGEHPETVMATNPSHPKNRPGHVGTGVLRIMSLAWADITVDGQEKGRLPRDNDLILPVGRHRLLLRNPGFKPYEATITITADETTEHKVTWQRADPADEGQ